MGAERDHRSSEGLPDAVVRLLAGDVDAAHRRADVSVSEQALQPGHVAGRANLRCLLRRIRALRHPDLLARPASRPAAAEVEAHFVLGAFGCLQLV
jgi:hypothetical protein